MFTLPALPGPLFAAENPAAFCRVSEPALTVACPAMPPPAVVWLLPARMPELSKRAEPAVTETLPALPAPLVPTARSEKSISVSESALIVTSPAAPPPGVVWVLNATMSEPSRVAEPLTVAVTLPACRRRRFRR